MKDTPVTYEAVERWNQGKINIFDEMARLERERDEAREMLMRIHGATCTLHTDAERSKIRCPICLKRERDEAQERECAAIESWWEEYQRALREGQRVVELREQNAKLRDIADGCLIALERATKYLPEYSRVNYEDALWRLRKKLEEETK